jgi:hypothetical protein
VATSLNTAIPEELMAQGDSLDREMLQVMRQAIAGPIRANPSAAGC